MAIQVGLRDLHYALLTKDDANGVTYATPERIAKAISAKIQVKSNTETLYADDGPAEVITSLEEIEVELEVTHLPLKVQAILLGHHMEKGVLTRNTLDHAPYVALGFRSLKSNQKYLYIWLYKGKFEIPEQEYLTKEDKPQFQTPKIKGTFIKRDFDGDYQGIGDEEEADFDAGSGWFQTVYEKEQNKGG